MPACDLSILKQCLRFEQRASSAHLATIRLYKITEDLDLYISDYIDCTEDLELILDQLASQQYTPVLSKLEENFYT